MQDPNAQAGKFGFEVDNTIGGTDQVGISAARLYPSQNSSFLQGNPNAAYAISQKELSG